MTPPLPPRLWPALLTLLAICLVAIPAFPKGIESTHISLPKGPGSIEGLGRTFAPSLASGTASYGVDIAMLLSAGGFSPSLSLDYDSAGGVTDIGIGWRIGGIPSVRRRTENGLPRFDASDAFEEAIAELMDCREIALKIFLASWRLGGSSARTSRLGWVLQVALRLVDSGLRLT